MREEDRRKEDHGYRDGTVERRSGVERRQRVVGPRFSAMRVSSTALGIALAALLIPSCSTIWYGS